MDQILQRLTEYYHAFLRVLPRLALAVFILVIGILVANWITRIFRKKLRQRSDDPLMSGFLAKAVNLILVVMLCLLCLNLAGLSGIAGALFAAAGASAVVLGFAFKDIAENFLAGIILAFNRPFQINDTVQIEDVFGKVREMEFRYTKIDTFNGKSVYIPNADVLTKPVFNYTEDNFFRPEFIVGIAYENDIEKAKQLIRQCLAENEEVIKDDTHVSFVVEDELAASTVNLKVFFWVNTTDFRRGMLETRGNIIRDVKTLLEKNGFNLPADIRELKFYDASNPFVISQKTKA